MIFNRPNTEEGEKIVNELKTQIWIGEEPPQSQNTYLLSYFSW
jgi:hypothetical protein